MPRIGGRRERAVAQSLCSGQCYTVAHAVSQVLPVDVDSDVVHAIERGRHALVASGCDNPLGTLLGRRVVVDVG